MAIERLWTEADVARLPEGSELELGPGVLATPAALDLCHRRGFRVVRTAEGGQVRKASCGQASSCDCRGTCHLWKSMLATDGTYVVVVENGEPTVSRLGPLGPEPLR